MTGWPHFGWAWLVAVAAGVVAMISFGLMDWPRGLWTRIILAMLVLVVVYMIALWELAELGIGV